MTEEEELLRRRRIEALCGMIDQLGRDNGSGEQYLMALTFCAGMYLRRVPGGMKESMLQQFLLNVRRLAKERSVLDHDN
jgi:hypothetical protein